MRHRLHARFMTSLLSAALLLPLASLMGCHGGGGSDGGSPVVQGVSIYARPIKATMDHGAVVSFTAGVYGTYDQGVTWSATGGVVDAGSGTYTAPWSGFGPVFVVATSNAVLAFFLLQSRFL